MQPLRTLQRVQPVRMTLRDCLQTWSGLTTKEYKKYKGLTKENLRDNMTNMELLLNALAEETATEINKQRNRKDYRKMPA